MKILFITATRIGDAILSTGLLDYIGERWPDASVTVACGKLCTSLFEGCPQVTRIIPMVKKPYNGHWISLWAEVIGTRWDMVVDLRDSAVSRLIPAKRRYIYGKHIDKTRHKAAQMAQVMGLPDVPAPRLRFSAAQEAFADQLMAGEGPVIGVGPAANWIGKSWPAENFIATLDWLTAPDGPIPDARVAVFAAPGEEALARPVLESIPLERRIDGIAKGTPGEAAAAIARCQLYIGNDSGLMHAAAASGVKTFGLFGPSYPHLYSPWGRHTSFAQTPESYDELTAYEGYSPHTVTDSLMRSLTVDTVRQHLRNFLAN